MDQLSLWAVIKRLMLWVICIPLSIILCIFSIQFLIISLKPYQVTSEAIVVHQTVTDNNNVHQNNADVDIIQVNDALYYHIKGWHPSLGLRSKFSDKLCTIENGQIQILQDVSRVYGSDHRFIYYKFDGQLMAYDTQLKKSSVLTQIPENTIYDVVSQSDGTMVFFIEDTECFSIWNGTMLELQNSVAALDRYVLGGKEYFIRKRHVYCQGEDITKQFGEASFRAIVPYQEGLLLINDGYLTYCVSYILGWVRA